MQVSEDPCGYKVKLEINDFYTCRYCGTCFVKLHPSFFRNTRSSPCMFCAKLFVCRAERDEHMCFDHENEDMPLIRCFNCGDRFVCIHDKEHHLCNTKPESDTAREEKKQIEIRLPKCLSKTTGEEKKQIAVHLPKCLNRRNN